MTRLSFLSATTASLAFMAGPLLADVTAADVKANYEAMVAALGGTLTSTEERNGDTVVLKNLRVDLTLPEDAGAASLTLPELTLTEKGGKVETRYPAEGKMNLSFKSKEGSATADMTMRAPDYVVIAEGEPEDITYTYDMPKVDILLDNIALEGFDMDHGTFDKDDDDKDDGTPESVTVTGIMTMLEGSGTTRVRTGDALLMDMDQRIGSMVYDVTSLDDDEKVEQAFKADNLNFKGTFSVPAAGISVMNLSQALRDGLALDYTADAENTVQTMTATEGDKVIMRQDIKQGKQSQRIVFVDDMLKATGSLEDLSVEMSDMPDMPLPVSFKVAKAEGTFALPVATSDAAKEGVFEFGLTGIEMADGIWAMFDPQAILPRDPATLKISLASDFKQAFDLLNFNRWSTHKESDPLPFTFETARLKAFELEAVGAKVAGEGAFTFDYEDKTTFPDMPRPDGTVNLNASGVNGLIDNLVKAGLVPEDQVMGVRMMLGMFAKPGDAEDTLTSEIKIENGQVFANGQRLR